jgi:hypothetical protein
MAFRLPAHGESKVLKSIIVVHMFNAKVAAPAGRVAQGCKQSTVLSNIETEMESITSSPMWKPGKKWEKDT